MCNQLLPFLKEMNEGVMGLVRRKLLTGVPGMGKCISFILPQRHRL